MIDHSRKLIFMHIPKNAGKSIETMINGNPVGNPHWQDLKLFQNISLGQFRDYYRFAIVRNPLDRIVSIFTYYTENSGNKSENDESIRKLLQSLGFNGFLEQLKEGFKYFESNLDCFKQDLYPHLIPQHSYIEDHKGRILMNHIGKFENLSVTIEELNNRFSEQFSLSHINRSSRKEWHAYFNDETFNLACSIFRDDIQKYYDLDKLSEEFRIHKSGPGGLTHV